jgi:L-ascorbate metabolism protein UlaG (beta-lactamase superfamily)
MERVTVMNLGIGALMIEAVDRRILIDAFNTIIKPEAILPGDVLIFTHDDGDHFSTDSLPVVKGMNITIIGPPSIVKPILLQKKADLEQIEVLYTNKYDKPSSISLDDINIICYHTKHFNHWDPIHNSYLIELLGKRLYITGDSVMTKEQAEIIGETDVVICNLVDEAYLKAKEEANVAIHHNLSYLLKVRSEGKTKKVIGAHLLDFNWTVEADDMKKLVEEYRFNDVIIPVSTKQKIII